MEALAQLTRSSLDSRIELLFWHARASLDAGDFESAEKSLAEALQLDPAHPESHYQLARLHQERGDPDAARRSLEKALETWATADASYRPAAEARELLASLGS